MSTTMNGNGDPAAALYASSHCSISSGETAGNGSMSPIVMFG